MENNKTKEIETLNEKKTCCICSEDFTEWGNNPDPVKSFDEGPCCNSCNDLHVIPARLRSLQLSPLKK